MVLLEENMLKKQMWEKIQNVKLKNYEEFKPKPSNLPFILYFIVFSFVAFAFSHIVFSSGAKMLPFCDSYTEVLPSKCIECPKGRYCLDGRIVSFDGDDNDSTINQIGSEGIVEKLKKFTIQFLKLLFIFCVIVCCILWFIYKKKWTDAHIKTAEQFYKELLLELTQSQNNLVKKTNFLRRLDQNYSPSERKFLEQKIEEIRKIDEQVTFVNEEGEIYYIFSSN